MDKQLVYKHSIHCFQFEGNDLIDLLNRISTNFIPMNDSSIITLLLDGKGKIIDQIIIYQNGSLHLLFINNLKTLDWIEKFTFTENYSIEKANFELYELIFNDIKVTNSIDETLSFKINEREFFAINKNDNIKILNLANNEQYHLFRINNLIQQYPFEISENYNPLEIGLIHQIDFKKGCYTGQEIIARLEAFKKVSKYLVRIKCDSAVLVGDDVFLDDKKLGKITTVSTLTNDCLAIVHRSIAKNDTNVQIISNSSKIIGIIDIVQDKFTYQNI